MFNVGVISHSYPCLGEPNNITWPYFLAQLIALPANKEPIETDYITFEIESVFEGDTYKDTCITEIIFN